MRVWPAAVTVWNGRTSCVFHPAALRAEPGERARLRQLASTAPVWVDMAVDADPTLWLEPWDATEADDVDWSAMEGLSELLGFALPRDEQRTTSSIAAALKRLPVLNELAVLRWLSDELAPGGRDSAVQLVGFIPVSTLRRRSPEAPDPLDRTLAFILLRVNAAVVGRFVFTIRLPDRLCVGVGIDSRNGRRVRADRYSWIASSHVHVVQQAERRSSERQARLQNLVGAFGAALVVPALVASLFSDDVRLPYPRAVGGLVAMLAVMFSSTLLVWWFLKFMNRRTGQGTSVSTMALFAAWPPAPACWSRAQERGDPSGRGPLSPGAAAQR